MKKQLLILLFFFAGTEYLVAQQEKEAQLIRNYRDLLNQAIERHDVDGIAEFLREDYTIVRGNAMLESGKAAVIAAWKTLFAGNKEVYYVRTPSTITISSNDSLAWETGSWKAHHSYSRGGNYSAMWRKTDKVWKLQAELFVSLK